MCSAASADALVRRRRRDELDAPELVVGHRTAGRRRSASLLRPLARPPRSAPSRTPRAVRRTSSERAARRRSRALRSRQSRHSCVRIPSASARSAAAPDHRPVGERVGERETELDQVCAALDRGPCERRRLPPAHQVDREPFLGSFRSTAKMCSPAETAPGSAPSSSSTRAMRSRSSGSAGSAANRARRGGGDDGSATCEQRLELAPAEHPHRQVAVALAFRKDAVPQRLLELVRPVAPDEVERQGVVADRERRPAT